MDVVLDPLGGDTPSFTLDVMKSWTGAKYVSLVMPVLPSTDKLGLIGGLAQSVVDFNFSAIKVCLNNVKLKSKIFNDTKIYKLT